jgi:hypothetical protein
MSRRNIISFLKSFAFAMAFCLLQFSGKAQTGRYGPNDTIKVAIVVVGTDTMPFYNMETATVNAPMPAHVKAALAKWTRLRNAVYVTYPYAISASTVFNDINHHLRNVTDKQERRRYIKSREKELKKNFSDKLTNLSVYQGKVLMKLIYRETGDHCYEIIKEMKGGVTARFWQSVAFLFGSNLKQTYDATGADAEMEMIVKEVARMYGRS